MDATTFVARLGPLAAMVGVGTAIAMSSAGVAIAEPSSVGPPASAQSDGSQSSSAASVGAEDHPGAADVDSGSTTSASAQSAASDAAAAEESLADEIGENAEPDVGGEAVELDPDPVEPELEPDPVELEPEPVDQLDPETAAPDVHEASAPDRPSTVEATVTTDARTDAGRSSVQSISASSEELQTNTSARASAAADSVNGFVAFFDNQTPTLSPTQTGQTSAGVVSGSLNVADRDSSAQTYTVTTNPTRGTVVIDANGGYRYTPDEMFAQTGTTDSFGVTVSDARSGFHIHGFMGWINLLSFGLFGSSRHSSTSTVSVSVAPFALPDPPPTDPPPTNPPPTNPPPTDPPPTDPPPTNPPPTNPPPTNPPPTDPPPSGSLAAFPGAEGFGSSATGGRGGSVVYVTNTNASGVGSLQWAIDQPGAKYILFKVSGLIDTQIHLTNGNVTIAGQSSPGGITVRGFVTDETPYQDQTVRAPSDFAENWILQHIRIRPGLDGRSDDGLRLRYTRNAVVDHVSIGNATDEAVEISYSNNITIQNSILAETVGGHSFYGGVLMNYSNPAHGFGLDNISLHHNIFNRIEGRLPEGSRESAAAANSTMNLELSNNLYWDPRFFIALGVDTNVVTDNRGNPYPIYWKLNAVNNFFRTGSQFPFGMFDDQILRVAGNQLYVSGNKMSLYPTRSDYELFYCCNDYNSVPAPTGSSGRAQQLLSRHPFPGITYTPTDMLRAVLLNSAGAWPRDPMDIRLMQSVADNTISSASPNTNPANDALRPAYSGAAPVAPVDTDGDGMPDAWELGKGLNPNVANHNANNVSTLGYTDLEVYLQELSATRMGQ